MEKNDSEHPGSAQQRPIVLNLPEPKQQGIDLFELWDALLDQKRLLIGVTLAFIALAAAYALLATPIYRAEVVLAPVSNGQDSSSRLGGLASLAGINLNSDGTKVQSIALLRSKYFAERFIREKNLLPVLFPDRWDVERKAWRGDNPDEQPDIRDGVKYFSERIRFVTEDVQTGLVTLAIEWTDPDQAAQWASDLVLRINQNIRSRDIEESRKKLDYLNRELSTAALLELRQAIARVIEEQISVMTMAQAQMEYVFKVIDPAVIPKQRISPKRVLIVILGAVCGFAVGVIVALTRSGIKKRQ